MPLIYKKKKTTTAAAIARAADHHSMTRNYVEKGDGIEYIDGACFLVKLHYKKF